MLFIIWSLKISFAHSTTVRIPCPWSVVCLGAIHLRTNTLFASLKTALLDHSDFHLHVHELSFLTVLSEHFYTGFPLFALSHYMFYSLRAYIVVHTTF